MPSYYEFFAGGGMVRAGLGGRWKCLFANDIDSLKVDVYSDNWGDQQILEDDIHDVEASDLPRGADLAWASFPCQDLSCAGNGLGIGSARRLGRTRSGTFWPFIDLMTDLQLENRLPRIIVLENVVGLLTINQGEEFKAVVCALDRLGYRSGALVLDAKHFVPQSRARVFIVAVLKSSQISANLLRATPHPVLHPDLLVKAVEKLPAKAKAQWLWFNPGSPPTLKQSLSKIILDRPIGVEWHSTAETRRLINMMSDTHRKKIKEAKRSGKRIVGTLSLRMRPKADKTVQRAEICFRGLAGCLRTPKGGGSRPRVIVVHGNEVKTRLLSPKEAASLMGLKANYVLPDDYTSAFKVIGDGVAVPVVSFLRSKLLNPLLHSIKTKHVKSSRREVVSRRTSHGDRRKSEASELRL